MCTILLQNNLVPIMLLQDQILQLKTNNLLDRKASCPVTMVTDVRQELQWMESQVSIR